MMKVAIRVDASTHIGSGHVMRCLSLADMLKKYGCDILFAMRPQPGDLCSLVESRGFKVVRLSVPTTWSKPKDTSDYVAWLQLPAEDDAKDFIGLVEAVDIVIVDHYAINLDWEKTVKSRLSCKLVAIDDLVRAHNADIVIDQTVGRDVNEYRNDKTPDGCIILAGTQFALLNSRFAKLHRYALQRPCSVKEHKLLISMGATDLPNSTLNILEALSNRKTKIKTTVLLGTNSPHYETVSLFCHKNDNWIEHIDFTDEMATLMLKHTIAIGASGSTSWERACMGLPSIIIPLADNQKEICKKLNESNVGISLKVDEISEKFKEKLNQLLSNYEEIAKRSLEVCDGLGCSRVARIIVESFKGKQPIFLRKATVKDIEIVYKWQCTTEVRAYSLNANAPEWEEHKGWMLNKLSSINDYFYIVEGYIGECKNFEPVGVVRLDQSKKDGLYTISIYLDPKLHGRGLGLETLNIINDLHYDKRIYAKVLKSNLASQKIFTKAGYTRVEEEAFIREQL